MKVLLTGGTGFIGSHIAELLVENGNELMIVKRECSSIKNISNILNKVQLVDKNQDWISRACAFQPQIIIHSAWSGISANQRDEITPQVSNINYINDLLYIADQCNTSKFIALGSQAEYGKLSAKVSEESDTKPINDYGLLKICTQHQIESYCELRGISWYWLRIFSVYGERESDTWLLPSVIKKAMNNEEMDLTQGKQKYAYLYVKDLATAILLVCNKVTSQSGIYNISSSHPIEIRELLSLIVKRMNSSLKLNFGVKPYRRDQSMHIEGDSSKFIKEFGFFEWTSLDDGIDKLINYYNN